MSTKEIEPGGCYQKFDETDRACKRCQAASRCVRATVEKFDMEDNLDALGLKTGSSVRGLIDGLGSKYVVVFHPADNVLSCLFKDGKFVRVQVLVSKKTLRVGVASRKTKGVIEAGKEFDVEELMATL